MMTWNELINQEPEKYSPQETRTEKCTHNLEAGIGKQKPMGQI